MKPLKRSRRKPPKGTLCDAYKGVDYDAKTPRIRRCGAPATVEFPAGSGLNPIGETWVCQTCAMAFESKRLTEIESARLEPRA